MTQVNNSMKNKLTLTNTVIKAYPAQNSGVKKKLVAAFNNLGTSAGVVAEVCTVLSLRALLAVVTMSVAPPSRSSLCLPHQGAKFARALTSVVTLGAVGDHPQSLCGRWKGRSILEPLSRLVDICFNMPEFDKYQHLDNNLTLYNAFSDITTAMSDYYRNKGLTHRDSLNKMKLQRDLDGHFEKFRTSLTSGDDCLVAMFLCNLNSDYVPRLNPGSSMSLDNTRRLLLQIPFGKHKTLFKNFVKEAYIKARKHQRMRKDGELIATEKKHEEIDIIQELEISRGLG